MEKIDNKRKIETVPFSNSLKKTKLLSLIKAKDDDNEIPHLYILDLENQKIELLQINELKNIENPSFCKISDNKYFVYGGSSLSTGDPVASAFIIDIEQRIATVVTNGPRPKIESSLIHHNGIIYALSGRKKIDIYDYVPDFESYDLKTDLWTKFPDFPIYVKGIQRIFIVGSKLVVGLYHCSRIVFDLDLLTWGQENPFVYEFDDFFIMNNGNGLLYNGYHSSLCEYDYIADQIGLKFATNVIGWASHAFFNPEYDAIVFVDHFYKKNFAIYYNQTEELKIFDSKKYENFFNNLKFIEGAENQELKQSFQSTFTKVEEPGLKNRALIFGNWHLPFRLDIIFKENEESVQIKKIPEKLFLKIQQGVASIDDDKLIFAGGFADDRSIFATDDVLCYNFENETVERYNNLIHEAYETVLKRIDHKALIKKQGSFLQKMQVLFKSNELEQETNSLVSDLSIIAITNNDEFERWGNKQGDWEVLPKLDSNYIPNILDEPNRLIFFYNIDDGNGNNNFFLKEYNFVEKKYIEHISIPTKLGFYINFCHKLKDNEYLILAKEEDDKISFYNLSIMWKNKIVVELDIKPVELFDYNEIKDFVLKYFIFDSILFSFYVNSEFNLRFFSLDLKSLKKIENERTKKLEKVILEAFNKLKILDDFSWQIPQFSLVNGK